MKPEAFRSLAGKEQMSRFKPGDETPRGGFCKHCGVHAYGWVDKAEWNDGASVSISVSALDDLDPADLLAAPVRFCDGRADNWWNPPSETRHL